MYTIRHSTDLTGQEWKLIKSLIPPENTDGRPRTVNIRKIIDGIFYISRTGSQWRNLPLYYPNWRTTYGYFRQWMKLKILDTIHDTLRLWCREKSGKKKILLLPLLTRKALKLPSKPIVKVMMRQKKLKVENVIL